jgi:hypothetical protein
MAEVLACVAVVRDEPRDPRPALVLRERRQGVRAIEERGIRIDRRTPLRAEARIGLVDLSK